MLRGHQVLHRDFPICALLYAKGANNIEDSCPMSHSQHQPAKASSHDIFLNQLFLLSQETPPIGRDMKTLSFNGRALIQAC